MHNQAKVEAVAYAHTQKRRLVNSHMALVFARALGVRMRGVHVVPWLYNTVMTLHAQAALANELSPSLHTTSTKNTERFNKERSVAVRL
jgi:hypothetical protein